MICADTRKKKQCYVTVSLSPTEKSILMEIAHNLGVSYNIILRRLVSYISDEKITLSNLFRKYNEAFDTAQEVDRCHFLRVPLEVDPYLRLMKVCDEWGSTPTVALKRLLLLYIAGKIDRREIWIEEIPEYSQF